ncbi:MAG: MBL fold metallo-hydrolase [Halobacteriaceae archaeon]
MAVASHTAGVGSLCRISVPVDTRAPGGETNCYLVGEGPTLLIDPGARCAELDAVVESRQISDIAVTHPHPDHVGALATYAAETGATVWGRTGRVGRFEDATGLAPDRTFSEGTTLPIAGGVTVHDTPGHAPDHVTFALGDASADGETAVVGDLLRADGSIYVGEPEGDMRAYLTTLRRLRAMGFQRLAPGHGPPIESPSTRLEAVIAHRLERERRVLHAVEQGAVRVTDIIDRAYDRELGELRDLAGQTVRAHLEKLAREGRLGWDGARAQPNPTGRFYPHRS